MNKASTRDGAGVDRRAVLLDTTAAIAATSLMPVAQAQTPSPQPGGAPSGTPNILVIMADDIGWFNTSAYNRGMMGYQTPNIDRIAREGAMFTDYYGEQSCTAGRSAFITGQSPFRTGLTQGRPARRRSRLAQGGPDDCPNRQAVGLCDGAVRQKPSRRQRRVPTHRARVR